MNELIFLYAPLALMALWGISFIARTLWVWRTTGENPNKVKNDGSIMTFCARIYGITGMAIGIFIVARIFYRDLDRELGTLDYIHHDSIVWIGLAIATLSTLFSIFSQIYMAKSWRIGIPDDAQGERPGDLVSGGPFRISRNPFFTGLIGNYIGLFLMMPNALTLAVIATIWATLNVQIRLEEEFLERTLGAPYSAYKATVRRWI